MDSVQSGLLRLLLLLIFAMFEQVNASLSNSASSSSSSVRFLSDSENDLRRLTPPEGCTTIGLTKEATQEQATMATHTNDCKDCDFRLSLVPKRSDSASSVQGVYTSRFAYPRFIGDDRGDALKAKYVDFSIYPWNHSQPIGFIPAVPNTFQWVDGSYALMNEKQVAIGESTCAARIVARPINDGGKALFDVTELTRIALARARSAREAISIMGGLAEDYGYYGAEYSGEFAFGEAGEALTVTDPDEAWIFHILPDDTGASAVWAAQRVPAGHIAVVANAFIIKEIEFSDHENFLYSKNIREVAIRQNFWNPSLTPRLHFSQVYGAKISFESYCTHRQWRVFTQAAPSLAFKLSYNMTTAQLPFSVAVEGTLSAQWLMNIQRDHFEGTPLDMSVGIAAGPFGNPNRYDRGSVEGVDMSVLMQGTFERPISLFRTSYSIVTMSRKHVDERLGFFWLAFAAPHASLYSPIYPFARSLPTSHTTESLFRFSRGSSWWATTLVQNWMERAYKYILPEVKAQQTKEEDEQQQQIRQLEGQLMQCGKDKQPPASSVICSLSDDEVADRLTEFQNNNARARLGSWLQLWEHLVAKFHDGYRLDDFHAETIDPTAMFYPLGWLKAVGFFPNGIDQSKKDWQYAIIPPTVQPFRAPADTAALAASRHLHKGEKHARSRHEKMSAASMAAVEVSDSGSVALASPSLVASPTSLDAALPCAAPDYSLWTHAYASVMLCVLSVGVGLFIGLRISVQSHYHPSAPIGEAGGIGASSKPKFVHDTDQENYVLLNGYQAESAFTDGDASSEDADWDQFRLEAEPCHNPKTCSLVA